MSKKGNRVGQKNRQRQKMSRRMILIVASSCALLFGGITAVVHFASVEDSKAQGEQEATVLLDLPQAFTTDMSLPAPLVLPNRHAGQHTILIRKIVTDSTLTNHP